MIISDFPPKLKLFSCFQITLFIVLLDVKNSTSIRHTIFHHCILSRKWRRIRSDL